MGISKTHTVTFGVHRLPDGEAGGRRVGGVAEEESGVSERSGQ